MEKTQLGGLWPSVSLNWSLQVAIEFQALGELRDLSLKLLGEVWRKSTEKLAWRLTVQNLASIGGEHQYIQGIVSKGRKKREILVTVLERLYKNCWLRIAYSLEHPELYVHPQPQGGFPLKSSVKAIECPLLYFAPNLDALPVS